MKNFKETGITLIALIVTIIILLILAGVTVGMATSGTGLFEKAKEAAQKYQNAQEEEEMQIAKYSNEIEYYASERATNKWTLLKSESGHTTDATAVTLPTNYSEILIEISDSNSNPDKCFTIYILKDMLLDTYKIYKEGVGWGSSNIALEVCAKKDKIYLNSFYNFSDVTSTAIMSIYYK